MSEADVASSRGELIAAVCDTLLPPLAATGPGGGWGESASARGISARVASGCEALPPHVAAAVEALLARLAEQGFAAAELPRREELLLATGESEPGRFALKQLKTMVFGDLFGSFDERTLRNPIWETIGFPGPNSVPPSPAEAPKTIPLESVSGDEATLTADVCVVGSGAGGAVIAARLAQAGKSVLVLEMGGYRNESDFRQLEAEGAAMYLGGGINWSEGGELGLLAGSTLGGGTVINSMACRPTPEEVRAEWAAMGIEGVDGPEWDGYFETVWEKLGANTEATHYNRNAEVVIAGLSALGLEHHRIPRNAELADDPRYCGYCNAGCQQGCKRSVMKTYLQDAADAGARFLVDCTVERVVTREGRAAGVEARVGETRVVVEAPTVVVACGGIESPALLLRSGIGGPAVGKNLRVHPTYMITGVYDEPVEAWNGQLITVMSFDFMQCEGEGGFYLSPLGLSPATWAGQSPWTDGRQIREHFLKFPLMSSWHSISHDVGSGEVVLGADQRALVRWRLEDEVDRRVAIRAHTELARVHEAAGAAEVFTFHWRPRHWRRGEDFDAYLEELAATPTEEYTAYSAHQMGSCRMGVSPAESVADGRGELHDVRGVWVGDAAALPTAPGVNPMVSIMVLAERTAARIGESLS
ncbi:MAG TPA: GMC family oxidoreductase [Solirubrobacterales bacterium]|nr:GMC family oxidoreductase [Solirubrobacterales bacterium]